MILSEMMTIVALFHLSKMRTFKDFYVFQKEFLKKYLHSLLSYNRFVKSIPKIIFPFFVTFFLHLKSLMGFLSLTVQF